MSTNVLLQSSALQSDGKIIVVGYTLKGLTSAFFVERLNANGTLDNTFGVNGIINPKVGIVDNGNNHANSVAIQKIGAVEKIMSRAIQVPIPTLYLLSYVLTWMVQLILHFMDLEGLNTPISYIQL